MSAALAGPVASLTRYEAILAHSELELELAGRGELEELESLGERWQELIAGLSSTPPPEAASLLERAKLIHERTHIELQRLRESLISEVNLNGRAKRAAVGYGAPLGRRSRLSHRA